MIMQWNWLIGLISKLVLCVLKFLKRNMLDWNLRVLCTHSSLRNFSVATVPDNILIKTVWVNTWLRSTKNRFKSIHVTCVPYSLLHLLPWWDTRKAFMKKTVIIWKKFNCEICRPCSQIWGFTNKSVILALSTILNLIKKVSLLNLWKEICQ